MALRITRNITRNITKSTSRLLLASPWSVLKTQAPRSVGLSWHCRCNSTVTEPKQFKKFTLPSSTSASTSASNPTTSESASSVSSNSQSSPADSSPSASSTKEFASHMDDLKNTKCVNQLISDHNDMPLSLSITERASLKLQELIKADNNDKVALVIKVESGGCHGFQYEMKLSEDYMADFHPDQDETMFVRDGVARVVIDKTSLEILRDSKIDYVHELIGSQFKVVDSPYTTSSCGCGSSFDFDFDKLAAQGSE